MNALTYWADIAVLLAGHQVVGRGENAVALDARPSRRTNNTAWGVGVVIILLAGFFTFGLSLLLLVPYLTVWAAMAVRATTRSRLYLLTVDHLGNPVTNPSGEVWGLLAAQRRIQAATQAGNRGS